MRSRSAILLIAAIVAAFVLAACGGDDTKATPEPATPVGTKEPTATASATDATNGSATAPAPADPQLDEQLTEIARGDLDAEIAAGESYSVDPQAIAGETGNVPSCDNFQFDFTWQVTVPYPPDGVSLQWELVREGGHVALSHDPSGEQSVGCSSLQAVNQGGAPISVAIKYAIGGIP